MSNVRTKIIRAALDAYEEGGLGSKRFAEICEAAEVAKASAYRAFPTGTQAVLCSMHKTTVGDVISAIRQDTDAFRVSEVDFSVAVLAGIRGACRGLRDTPYFSRVLCKRRDLATAYLLNRSDEGIVNILSLFTARCTALFGSKSPDIQGHSKRFVWRCFSRLLEDFPEVPGAKPWPDPDDAEFDDLFKDVVASFAKTVGLGSRTQDGFFLPEVSMPVLVGNGLPIEAGGLIR